MINNKDNRKYNVLDTFAGAGGFSLGFLMSGHFNIIGAIERDLWAAETFKYNHPNTDVIIEDITKVTNDFLISKFKNKVDILLGGPPCQGFSIANKNAGDPKDPRNSLFIEFIRIASVLSPSVVIMENVPNLIKAKTLKGDLVINIIINELEKLGYNVEYTILEATSYGVPQIRKRLVIIASKNKFEKYFPTPTHTTKEEETVGSLITGKLKLCPTLWDAISDLPDIEACGGNEEMDYPVPPQNDYQRLLRDNSNKVYNHLAMKHSKRMVERFASMKWGESTSDVADEFKPIKRNGNGEKGKGYDQNNRRMFPNRQCHTIAASFYANFVHPYKNRNFTAREGARIQSFPDWYIFKGRPTVPSHSLLKKEGRLDELHLCQYNQVGNAVPPLLANAIANNVYEQLINSNDQFVETMFVHGDNITHKEGERKYSDPKSKQYLREIREKYIEWKDANMKLIGPVATPSTNDFEILKERVKLLEDYKNFIDQQKYAEGFDSRGNLQSSVIEEFCYYLFKDLVDSISKTGLVGKSHSFKDIFFNASSYIDMVTSPNIHIEKKDHDFVIGVSIESNFHCKGEEGTQIEELQIPAVAIECKTYLDKTMLEGASNAAAQLISINPNAIYIVLAEWLKLTGDVNLKKYKVDQIYILRKQKNTDRELRYLPTYQKNPIYVDVVENLFNMVRTHLTTDWNTSTATGLEKGFLLY